MDEDAEDEKEILQERIRRIRDELSTREVRKRKSEERAAQLRKEAQEKSAQLADLTAKVEAGRLKLQALRGEEVRFRERDYVPFENAAARVDPRDAVAATKKRLDELQSILDRSSAQKDLPTYVDVHFNAYVCSFALSRNTTFDSLREEACLHWGVPQQSALLKNSNDDEYKGSNIVQVTLADEAKNFGTFPYVRLHQIIQTSTVTPGVLRRTSGGDRSGPPSPLRKRVGLPNANQGGIGHSRTTTASTVYTGGEGTTEGDEDKPQHTRAYIRQKEREAWQARVMHLSHFFHDAEYITKIDPDMEKEIPKARRRYYKVRLARSCLWVILWATTLGLCIATMVFRFDTASAFASALEVYDTLGEQEFCVPLSAIVNGTGPVVDPNNSQVAVSSSCGTNEVVRRFGGFSSEADILTLVPPSQRVLNIQELFFWGEQVLYPALGLGSSALRASNTQKLVSTQSKLLGNNIIISYAKMEQSTCNGLFYTAELTCPCYRGYDPDLVDRNCPAPFSFSTRTPLGSQAGSIRPVYLSEGCEVQTNGENLPVNVNWLGDGVSVVQVDFNLLNLNMGCVTQVQVIAEVGATGLVVTSIHTAVLPLSVYEVYAPQNQALVIVGDVFLFVYALLAVWFWILRPRLLGMTTNLLTSLITIWNLLAVLLLLVSAAQIGLGIGWEFSVASSINLDPSQVQLLTTQNRTFQAYLGLSTVSLFLLILMVFKHFQSDVKTSNIFQTLHRSARPLAALGFLLVLALASMSVWANLAWGSYVVTWTRLEQCVAVLAGMIFGAPVDFAILRLTQNTQLWIVFFFLVWVGLVILILVQFLGAIVLDSFLEIEAVSLERRRTRDQLFWFQLLISPSTWFEPSSVDKRNKKVSRGFRKYFGNPWKRVRRTIGF